MFTGIIQEIGRVEKVSRRENLILTIESETVSSNLKTGDSVAINGVCQTIVESSKHMFAVEAIEETLTRTNLGRLGVGDYVNLEPPLASGEMFHGHFVQGHVDCTGRITSIVPGNGSDIFSIEYPNKYDKYVIEKGSISIDGISLTVTESRPGMFAVAIIPHTRDHTIMKFRTRGDEVNLEFDMIARYVERMMNRDKSELTFNFLKEHGFGS